MHSTTVNVSIVRQEVYAIAHAMVHSTEIFPSFELDWNKNMMML